MCCKMMFTARRRSRKYCSRMCNGIANRVLMKQRINEGKFYGFRKGHKNYLKHHSKEAKENMKKYWKDRYLREGQHPNSINTRFNKGHKIFVFKGMHSKEGLKRLSISKTGKKNPMYGKPLSEKQKELMNKGLRKLLLDYGIGLQQKSLKGLKGLPWIDYQLNAEEFRGVKVKLRGYKATNSTYWKRKYGIEDDKLQKDEIGFKIGKSVIVFRKEAQAQKKLGE